MPVAMVDNDIHCKWLYTYVMKHSAGTSLQCYVDQTLSRFREGVATADYQGDGCRYMYMYVCAFNNGNYMYIHVHDIVCHHLQ